MRSRNEPKPCVYVTSSVFVREHTRTPWKRSIRKTARLHCRPPSSGCSPSTPAGMLRPPRLRPRSVQDVENTTQFNKLHRHPHPLSGTVIGVTCPQCWLSSVVRSTIGQLCLFHFCILVTIPPSGCMTSVPGSVHFTVTFIP